MFLAEKLVLFMQQAALAVTACCDCYYSKLQ